MRKLRSLLLLCLLSSIAAAQTTLQPGTPVERELTTGQVHEFTVTLEENNFVQLVVEQRGIDVIVKVFSPSGKSLGDFDSPNGNDGPENVSFVAVAAGNYRVTVAPLEPKDGNAGRYQIKIVEVRQATEQELKTTKNFEATKAKGLALLAEIEATIPQIKSPQTRIRSQFQAAQLLWDIDEKRASKLLADAMAGFKDYVSSIDPADLMFNQSPVWQLRQELVTALAARDPDAALNFLQATSQVFDGVIDRGERSRLESSIELMVADQAIRNNPKRALQIARQNLKRGYSPQLINTLAQLRNQNPEMAAELANEIVSKISDEKFLQKPEASFVAMNLIQLARDAGFRQQRANGDTTPPIVSEDKINELIRKMFDESTGFSPPARAQFEDASTNTVLNMLHSLRSLSSQIDSIVPGGMAAVEKKIAELSADPGRVMPHVAYALANSSDLSPESIAKMPAEVREQFYIQLANTEAGKGNAARAKQVIEEHVTNPYQKRQALLNVEQQQILQAISKGKGEEALRALGGFRNSRERAQQLAQIASLLGPGLKRAAALSLLEQARGMISPSLQAQDGDQMYALFEIARAFSRYDAKRAFEIMDPLIDQFNDLCGAARMLDGFGMEFYDGEELNFLNGNQLASIAGQMSNVLGALAVINFDRAKSTTDRLRAPEVRLKIYLDIAQQTIKAAK